MLAPPAPSGVVLPSLDWKPSGGYGPRHGSRITRVVAHRWGSRIPADEHAELGVYLGNVAYLRDPKNKASAHIVMPGSIAPGEASQLVRWTDYAWTEAAYNPTSVEIEFADAIWVPDEHGKYDELGFEVGARMVAFLLASGGGLHDPRTKAIPPVWSHERGFCRHADLGAAGGGHASCPTTDMGRWRHFCARVQFHYHLGGFRPTWGLR